MIKGLPEKIQRLRRQFGLSQKAVAQKLGVSAAIVSAYESGDRSPSTEMLLALSQLFQCSTDYLLNYHYHENPNIDVSGLTNEQITALHVIVDSMRN